MTDRVLPSDTPAATLTFPAAEQADPEVLRRTVATLQARTHELERVATRLRLAAEAGRLGTWEWELPSRRISWSPEIERIHGLEIGSFAGTFEAFQLDLHPEDRPRVMAQVEDTITNHTPYLLQYRIIIPSGDIRWIEARGQVFLDDNGQADRVVGICMDITERKRAEEAQAEQVQLQGLTGAVGLALTRAESLPQMLQGCVEAVVEHLDAAFARVWTLDATAQTLELQASAGLYRHLDGAHARVPVGQFKIGRIAEERRPHLTNDVQSDPRVGDREWARREGMRAFAGYPLTVDSELVGVLAMFAKHPLSPRHLDALATVANGVALGIQRKRAEEALAQHAAEMTRLAAALERSNRELDAFAYAASHDLRAPLRGIANLAQWIREDLESSGELRPELADMLDLMHSRMHRMEALIEGILQYSRAGRVSQKTQRVDAGKLVHDVVDLLSPPETATIRIGDLPTFDAPALPLQQVFMNLIGNALKHAERPDAMITVDCEARGRFYEFSVKDNGPGIPPQFHDRVWGIFQTLAPRDKVEGTGIGLSLVKKLVEAHGGRVWLESQPGQGAAFFFAWPKRG